jgi:hypothetical protein
MINGTLITVCVKVEMIIESTVFETLSFFIFLSWKYKTYGHKYSVITNYFNNFEQKQNDEYNIA